MWSLHLVWFVAATVAVIVSLWTTMPEALRWVIVGLFAYGVVVTPPTMAWTLRLYWNAPQAAEENRKLVVHGRERERT